MDLRNIVAGKGYSGLATFSDIHAHAKKLKKGIKYALNNNLFIVFLGDLVDGHDKPLETVLAVKTILDEGNGVLVIGNHDDKFYRYAKGNPVKLKKANKQTLADVPKGGEELFLQTIIELNDQSNNKNRNRLNTVLSIALQEIDMPKSYYNLHYLSKELKLKKVPKIDTVIEELRNRGAIASRTHFDFKSIKTNMNINQLKQMLVSLY